VECVAGFSSTADAQTSNQHAYWRVELKNLVSVVLLLALTLPAPVRGAGAPAQPGNKYYFAAAGLDRNDCKSKESPCQTITKANSLSYGQHDNLLLKGGDSFTGCLSLTYHNVHSSADAPLTVNSYGAGNATLLSNCPGRLSRLVNIDGVSGLILKNLTLSANGTTTWWGVLIQNSTSAPTGNITVENNDISGFHATGSSKSDYGAEIFVIGFSLSGSCAGLTNINILNNTLHGASGISSADDSGAGGYGCRRRVSNVLQQGNLIYNIGGHDVVGSGNGLVGNGTTGSTIQFDLAHDIGWNVNATGGPVGLWFNASDGCKLQFSETYNMRPKLTSTTAYDFDGFDLDGETTNCVMQYLYSHDNFGYGYLLHPGGTWGPHTLRYSISESDTTRVSDVTAGVITLSAYAGAPPMVINVYNMTVWTTTPNSTHPGGFAMAGGLATGGVFANNIIALTKDSLNNNNFIACANQAITRTGIQFKNNDYYSISNAGTFRMYTCGPANSNYTTLPTWQSAAPGGDTSATQANPALTGGGTGGTLSWTPGAISAWPPSGNPSGYALSNGSAMKGAGANLPSQYGFDTGLRDYFANTIPGAGSCYNIGAYGACP